MKWIVTLLVLVALIGAGIYWQFFYPPTVLKRATQTSLTQFTEAVATKDRAQISQALEALLTEDAEVRLEVSFFSVTRQLPPVVQEFPDRDSFIRFMDNLLYTLSDYAYEPMLQEFKLSDDRAGADVSFSSKQWADGTSYYGGIAVGMRFSSTDTLCAGSVRFEGERARLAMADCKLSLMSVPKPGEAAKIQGETLKEYLLK
jgi:hypothetical protein